MTLRDITDPIIPRQANADADRDFDGNGPDMAVVVHIGIARGGRAIFANVEFTASERGGDGSAAATGSQTFELWRWQPADGARFVRRILTDNAAVAILPVPNDCRASCAITGPVEDGAPLQVLTLSGNALVNQITYLGDTMGDDISTDDNPHGDTSIRRITFHDIRVEFTDQLARN